MLLRLVEKRTDSSNRVITQDKRNIRNITQVNERGHNNLV